MKTKKEMTIKEFRKIAAQIKRNGLNLTNSGDESYEFGFDDGLNYFYKELTLKLRETKKG